MPTDMHALREGADFGHDDTVAFRAAVLFGLTQEEKAIEPKWLYDEAGSRLFDQICALEEYYPTRTEMALLKHCAADVAEVVGPGIALVEFGSGSSVKVRFLLDHLKRPAAYVPVDISREHLLASAEALARDYPQLPVFPVVADYTRPFSLPADIGDAPPVGFFPGSTIGNFAHGEAEIFLAKARQTLVGGELLLGVDLIKDEETLLKAYNDRKGVTAAFNLNLLTRINRELGADFDLNAFVHEARFNPLQSRIEMHLVSLKPQTVTIAGTVISFRQGETIHTENSHKFSIDGFQALARCAGWDTERVWTDERGWFSLQLLRDAAGSVVGGRSVVQPR